jgi:hypothetical protein
LPLKEFTQYNRVGGSYRFSVKVFKALDGVIIGYRYFKRAFTKTQALQVTYRNFCFFNDIFANYT